MATLNLSKIKHMSEANLKKFANLIISLSSQVTDVENKCIKPYIDGELYPRDSYVSYNGYIYQATATNQDSAFDETHWDKLSDDFNELTVADIEAMLGLSQEQLETMAKLIADTEVRLDKTYSSSKIYQDIQQCLNDSKAFTLLELGKLSGASYKVVASTSEMTSESIIYLLASGNTYDMYIVEENGATTKIGNMDVNLDNYFTKTEIEADYLKKADADGKYATITTVDSHISDTDIHVSADEKASYAKKTVADVGKTLITFPDSTNHKVVTSAETYYIVKNDICYVHLAFGCVLRNATTTIIGLPLPLSNANVYAPQAVPYDYADLTSDRVRVSVDSYGILKLVGGTAGIPYICSFSYPVAE